MPKQEICYIRCELIPLGTGPGNLAEWFAFAYVDEPGEKHAHLIYQSGRFDMEKERTSEMFKLIEWLESQGWEQPGGGRWTGGFAPSEFRRAIR